MKKKEIEQEIIKYRVAYDLLMDYWDYLPDDEKPVIEKELNEVGL